MGEQGNAKKSVITSLFYKFVERCGYQGIAFIVQIVLARLLDPTDYGMLTLLTIFINVSQVFVQSGLNTALIQRKDVKEEDYSSVFYISIIIAAVMYVILFFAAPFISDFYEMPPLAKILRVLALILIPGAFNSIQNAKIAKEMKFKQLMICTLVACFVSGVIGIAMAAMNFGVWALVGQQISNQIVICITMMFVVQWRPTLHLDLKRVGVLFSFGWKLLCSNLIDTVYRELRSLAIGKKYDSGTLGYYNRGKQFPELIINNVDGSIQSVMLPALAKEQDNKERLKAMMRRSILTSSYVIFPIVVGLAVVADSLIPLVLTEKWNPCIPFLRIYCFTYAFRPIHTSNLQALNAQGRSDVFLKLEIIKKAYGLGVLLITVFLFHTPLAIAMGGAVTTLISCFVNASPNKKLLNYSYLEQIKDIVPNALISLLMGAAVYAVNFLRFGNIITLCIQVFLGAVLYVAISYVTKNESFKYLIGMVRKILKR